MEKTKINLPEIGKLTLRSTDQIHGSNWTLGCETLDRDFADFDQYKEYIVPLGIKTVRFQGGWGKTEKQKGVYDFRWLDHLIDEACARKLNILLETDYGNPIYEGGGGFDLGAGFPTSEEALAGWDRWVEAMAQRYRGKVRDWAMWNEPDLNPKHTPEEIARFNIRTARIIKQNIPDARIAGLSLASPWDWNFEKCVKTFAAENALDLFTWFIYHGYSYVPEKSFGDMETLKRIIRKYSGSIRLRQGENGCPSESPKGFALADHPWTELSQAKWDLRRYLGDLGHDVESAVFTICDFNHIGREINRKGLLLADAEHRVIRPKQAYYAIQNMTAVFDDRLHRVENKAGLVAPGNAAIFTYTSDDGGNLAVYWDYAGIPGDSLDTGSAILTTRAFAIEEPVAVDLRTGVIYALESSTVERCGDIQILKDVPYYDSPILIGEKRFFL